VINYTNIIIDDVEKPQSPEDTYTQHQHHLATQNIKGIQEDVLEPIDLSTTYFWVEKTCKYGSLFNFAETKQSNCKPRDIFGYVEANDEEPDDISKKKIVMEKVTPQCCTRN
jgi:hypothetical protein